MPPDDKIPRPPLSDRLTSARIKALEKIRDNAQVPNMRPLQWCVVSGHVVASARRCGYSLTPSGVAIIGKETS